jgi:acyl-CoA reductase-like NAD-dependent aldehyde dehydrogenase
MDLFISKAKQIKVGDPLDPTTQMGPLVSEKQLKRVEHYVQKGLEEGASLTIGGQRHKDLPNGYFFTPTIFENVDNSMTIAQEEIFGPVLSVIRFKDEEDVLTKANDTIYGLTAGVWTNDLKRAFRMARGLKAGTVYLNNYGRLDGNTPFGGYKQSGFGRELGIQAMEMYLNTKHVWVDLSDQGANWYGY